METKELGQIVSEWIQEVHKEWKDCIDLEYLISEWARETLDVELYMKWFTYMKGLLEAELPSLLRRIKENG